MAHYPNVLIASSSGYRTYVAQLTQNLTGAPSAGVVFNTLGYTPTWSRTATGFYNLTATEFLSENANKVLVFFNSGMSTTPNLAEEFIMNRAETLWSINTNEVILKTGYMKYCEQGGGCNSTFEYTLSDNMLSSSDTLSAYKANFELRIYN